MQCFEQVVVIKYNKHQVSSSLLTPKERQDGKVNSVQILLFQEIRVAPDIWSTNLFKNHNLSGHLQVLQLVGDQDTRLVLQQAADTPETHTQRTSVRVTARGPYVTVRGTALSKRKSGTGRVGPLRLSA